MAKKNPIVKYRTRDVVKYKTRYVKAKKRSYRPKSISIMRAFHTIPLLWSVTGVPNSYIEGAKAWWDRTHDVGVTIQEFVAATIAQYTGYNIRSGNFDPLASGVVQTYTLHFGIELVRKVLQMFGVASLANNFIGRFTRKRVKLV